MDKKFRGDFMDTKKYELTSNTRIIEGRTLNQIRALKSFGSIKKGDFGGWIENEANLSQDGYCWVAGTAAVYGNARVFDNAMISNQAIIYDQAWIFGHAWVFDQAQVFGQAKVYDNARIFGEAKIFDLATIAGNAEVYQRAWISGISRVFGNTDAFGDVLISGNTEINGQGVIQSPNDVLTIDSIGDNEVLTAYTSKQGVQISMRGFQTTLTDFESYIAKREENNPKLYEQYQIIIKLIKNKFNIKK